MCKFCEFLFFFYNFLLDFFSVYKNLYIVFALLKIKSTKNVIFLVLGCKV